MAREHVIGIVTGLVLLASVLGMIGSMSAVARVLRAPPAMAEMMAIAYLNLMPAKRR
jgi:hypothetical protein